MTRWTVVRQAGDQLPAALDALCQAYRDPLLGYLLARGVPEPDAQDGVQRFFERICAPGFLTSVSAGRGRFRSWLLETLKNQLADARDHEQAARRGGGVPSVHLDAVSGEGAAGMGVADRGRTPDEEYEYRWARRVLANAWERLREDMTGRGQGRLFEALEPVLYRDEDRASYRQIAQVLGFSETGARSAALRMRAVLRRYIWEEVAGTVVAPEENPAEVDAEFRHLMRVLGR